MREILSESGGVAARDRASIGQGGGCVQDDISAAEVATRAVRARSAHRDIDDASPVAPAPNSGKATPPGLHAEEFHMAMGYRARRLTY
jgi:hypothetical protein